MSNQKVEIKDLIETHLKIQDIQKILKTFKSKRKELELKLYAEFKKENLESVDLGKFRLYIFSLLEPHFSN
jgi:hypothetical protein